MYNNKQINLNKKHNFNIINKFLCTLVTRATEKLPSGRMYLFVDF